MKERIGRLLGDARERRLVLGMGTSHSVAIKYCATTGISSASGGDSGLRIRMTRTRSSRGLSGSSASRSTRAAKNMISGRKAKGGWGTRSKRR